MSGLCRFAGSRLRPGLWLRCGQRFRHELIHINGFQPAGFCADQHLRFALVDQTLLQRPLRQRIKTGKGEVLFLLLTEAIVDHFRRYDILQRLLQLTRRVMLSWRQILTAAKAGAGSRRQLQQLRQFMVKFV